MFPMLYEHPCLLHGMRRSIEPEHTINRWWVLSRFTRKALPMRKNDVIDPMLTLHAQLAQLAPPRSRGYYTSTDLTSVIGRKPNHADATALRNLGWLRTAREVNGKTARVWIPPTHTHMIFDSTPT